MKKILILSLVALCSCEKPICEEKPNDEIAGIVVRVLPDNYLAYRQEVGDLARDGIQINTAEQYRQVFDYCCAGKLDSVDFAKNDILGVSTVNEGMNSTYLREVQIDEAAKKVVYTVTERYCQRSSPVEGNGNFVVVPKLPQGYAIEFIRN